MRISFNLKTPKAKESPVRLIVTHKGQVFRRGVGITVPTKDWSVKKQKSGNPTIDDELKRIRIKIEERLNDLSPVEDVESVLKWALDRDANASFMPEGKSLRPTFWVYFKEYADRPVPNHSIRDRRYRALAELMGTKEDWEDIDSSYYYRLVDAMDKRGWAKNYQSSIIATLKAVMNEGIKRKFHRNLDFQDFKKFYEDSDAIYLTEEELQKLWDWTPTTPALGTTRDLFLLGVYTASRHSDYSRMSMDNIVNGQIRFTQKKTSDSVVMPCNPKVKIILERNGGKAPYKTRECLNMQIKKVCQLAGIEGKIEHTKSVGARHITSIKQKWELVTSHTARRTGATLLYKSGVPVKSAMMITGHKSESNFFRYIRYTKEENALNLADNPFFK